MPTKTSKKPSASKKNARTTPPKSALPDTPAGYFRAPVYGLIWPAPDEHLVPGLTVSGVLADIDTASGWYGEVPLPALVLMVDEPTRAWDALAKRIVEVPSRGAVRICDAGFAKFSRLLTTPGKVPHLFVRVGVVAPSASSLPGRPSFVVDVSTHPHDAAAYGLSPVSSSSSAAAPSSGAPAPVPGSEASSG
jgi:hypothetical protein